MHPGLRSATVIGAVALAVAASAAGSVGAVNTTGSAEAATAAGAAQAASAAASVAAAKPGKYAEKRTYSRPGADPRIERKVNELLAQMNTEEKLQQIQLLSDAQVTDKDARDGLGGVFSLVDPVKINHFQRLAVEESRLGIPILFAYDTIHGYRTVFPIPLGAASSFDPNVAYQSATFAARESAAVGLKQIYSPMVDVSHEARWGRVAEGAGEDPYLGSRFAAAHVRGAQGGDYSAPDKVVTSVKHLAGYGQPEAGRDYNTTDMSERRLRNMHLPPFKAAVEAGADTAMCSFNAINGVPGCANKYLETDILKKEWGFDGFIESDYTAVAELRVCPQNSTPPPSDPTPDPNTPNPIPDSGACGHGVANDGPDAAEMALNAGTDSEMVSTLIRDNATYLLDDGRITMARLNDAVRRILRVKFRAGLFENPYVDPATAESKLLLPDAVAAAREAAGRSMVLLKNQGATLPMDPRKKTAVIGPLGDNQHDMLGPWWGNGKDADAVTVYAGIKALNPATTFAQGCTIADKEPPNNTPADECGSDSGFAQAVAAAKAADQVVLALGESRGQSGEAASRSEIDLPGLQEALIAEIAKTGKPFVVVLFNGRPLTLDGVVDKAPAILEAWFPGTTAGNAVADVVFGKVNPGGKLPITFPRRVGQVPIYYNHEPTGRPCNVDAKFNSRYRDIPSCDPQYEFGYGLSYTTFEMSNLRLDKAKVGKNGSVKATVRVKNTGTMKGDEVAQLYIHDRVASLSQPVRRLRGFQRVTLAPGESRTVSFTLDSDDFGFYDNRAKFVVEPGQIDVYAGNSSKASLKKSFVITG